MGACLSRGGDALSHIDDSVHVMLKHDKKKRKESGAATTAGYTPRAANPALEKKRAEQEASGGAEANGTSITAEEMKEEEKTEES